jgi:transposase
MIHNFWSHKYIAQRLREKAEKYGVRVKEVNEEETSSICPFCGSSKVSKQVGLFKCLKCGIEDHRDVLGVLNIAALRNGGRLAIGVMAHPLLLRWARMRWEPKRAVNTRPMSILEAKNRIHRDDGGIPHPLRVGGRQSWHS